MVGGKENDISEQKSPESIAEDILEMNRKNPTMDNSRLLSLIANAIKAERENNRLVLPERRILKDYHSGMDIVEQHTHSYDSGFNDAIDAVESINEGRVKPDAELQAILCEKISCAKGRKLFRTTIELETFCLDNLEPEVKYRVEFYKLDEG